MPTNHHTKNKGDFGVLKAKIDLVSKGYMILSPETEHAPFDLVAYQNGDFYRIQVKYRSAKNGLIRVVLKSVWADKNGTHVSNVDKNSIDYFCVFCPDTDECYYFNPKNIEGYNFAIRIHKAKNNQTSGVHFSNNFLDFPPKSL